LITRLVKICLLALLIGPAPGLAQESLELKDGWTIQYFLALPGEDSSRQSPWPLAVFMGGGSGNAPISYEVYRFYARELASLGWAVAVPVSPDNRSFRGANVDRVRELVSVLQAREDVAQGKTLLAGISAGGMSALEIARRYPEEILAVMAVPALVRNAFNLKALAGMPVYLRIGSDDELGWGMQFEETVEALTEVGVKLDAQLLYGEPHMFGLDWDRVSDWLSTLPATP
jgi:dienelactone hydrolase